MKVQKRIKMYLKVQKGIKMSKRYLKVQEVTKGPIGT